eukprot:gb/GFBE01015874.1/.p1 GENE.gb/GFBE01015874.1/~~gb/GFBE01015874.1/.p1  ORF type:complete len:344 (+),score=78.65 gb/GFBE01015874.1/:1-1032(+)
MKAELLKRDGKVVLMEVGSDFADLLLKLLKMPLGAVAGGAEGTPLGTLQASMTQLREPVFQGSKQQVLDDNIDLATLSTEVATIPDPLTVSMSATRLNSQSFTFKSNGDNNIWNKGAAFASLIESSFEVSLDMPMQSPIMLGIAPVDGVYGQQLQTKMQTPMYMSCGYFIFAQDGCLYAQDGTSAKSVGLSGASGSTVSMKFCATPSPVLSYSVANGPWVVAHFNQPIACGVQYCPVVLARQALEMKVTFKSEPSAKAFNAIAKFLVTNELEISESSSLNTLQLLQQQNVDMSGLEIVSVLVTPQHLKRMVARAFMGEKDVLQYAFGESLTPQSSEQSFVMHG